jgi:hypothetical protein
MYKVYGVAWSLGGQQYLAEISAIKSSPLLLPDFIAGSSGLPG